MSSRLLNNRMFRKHFGLTTDTNLNYSEQLRKISETMGLLRKLLTILSSPSLLTL